MSSGSVLIGYDGSDESRTALAWAVGETDADVELLAIAALGHESAPLPLAGVIPHGPGDTSRTAQRIAHQWVQDTSECFDLVRLVFARGKPAQVLAAVAAREKAELLVVGHRRGRRLEAARSSVAQDLLRIAPCPVVIVP